MRVTSYPASPDHWKKHFVKVRIMLNGIEQFDVCEADDVTGTVKKLIRDTRGRLITKGQGYAAVTLHGTVTFDGVRK